MAGRVAGKVAFVTGAARGQGRSHAIRLAEEGADIIAVDILQDYETVSYGMGTQQDLADTVTAVAALGRKIIARKADVRDAAAMRQVVDEGAAELGKLDIAVANAGICTVQAWDEVTPAVWQDTIDTNLTGVWHTMAAAIPHLIGNGGGSIICVSSTAGIKGLPFFAPYVAAKHGVVGLAKSMANELARHNIRVNTVHPTGVNTPMGTGLAPPPPHSPHPPPPPPPTLPSVHRRRGLHYPVSRCDRSDGFRCVTRGYCCCQTAYTTSPRSLPDHQESAWPSSSSRPRIPPPSTARR